MYDEFLADIYDDLYVRGRGKDYATEAKELAKIVAEHHPAPSSLLDVACGTGLHLAHLRQTFDRVEGLEISLPMLKRARQRLPNVRFHHGDMRTFRLDDRFDVVTCLFAAAGYVVMTLATTAEYVDALLAAGCEEAFAVPGRSEAHVRVIGQMAS